MAYDIGTDNVASERIVIAAGSTGVSAACGLLYGESLHLEYGIASDCGDVCWVTVMRCGEPVTLDNDNNPMPFAEDYQGLFRWVADLPLNANARVFSKELTAGVQSCRK